MENKKRGVRTVGGFIFAYIICGGFLAATVDALIQGLPFDRTFVLKAIAMGCGLAVGQILIWAVKKAFELPINKEDWWHENK